VTSVADRGVTSTSTGHIRAGAAVTSAGGGPTLAFLADRRACLRTVHGRSVGTWSRTGSTTFAYKIKEAMMDSDGTQTGWVHIDQNATATASSFTSVGDSTVTDMNGNYLGTSPGRVSATYDAAATRC